MVGMRNGFKILAGKLEGKRPLARYGRRWEILRKWVWEGVGWMQVAEDRDQWRGIVNTVMDLRVS
jgi:hypothetical protein